MRDHDDLSERLTDLGSAPVPPDVRDGHLHAMRAAVPAPAERRRFGRLAVAAAAIVGFAAGSTGFAMAGALPDPAQGVAHDVLAIVQVDVPDRPENHGACVSSAAKNAGPAAKQAAKEACRVSHPPGRQGFPADHPNGDEDPCTGKPPWAGPMDPGTREALKAQHAECRGPDDEVDDAAAEELERQQDAEEEAREAEEERLEAEQDALEEQQEAETDALEEEPTEVEPEALPAEPELPEPAPDGGSAPPADTDAPAEEQAPTGS